MKSKNTIIAGIGVTLFALVLGSAHGETLPWGEAWGGGAKIHDLTNRTTSAGACLDTADLGANVDEVRFAAGEILVDHIDIEGRDIRFVGAASGTTLKPDPESYGQAGSAISVAGGKTVVTNLTFSGFYAETAGGAVSIWSATGDCAIQDCRFTGCRSSMAMGVGGAVYASAAEGTHATLSIVGSSFTDCQAADGGAVTTERVYPYKEKAMALSISGSVFTDDDASYLGGAIWNEGDITLENTSFTGCHACLSGGAVCSGSSDEGFAGLSIELLTGVAFDGNSATDAYATGGAIALMSPGIRLAGERATFLSNVAESAGGALFACSGSVVRLSTSIFSNNTVIATNDLQIGSGGAITVEYGSCALTNLTVRGSNGGALDFYRTDAQVVNCVAVGNGDCDISGTTSDGIVHALTIDHTAYGALHSDAEITLTTKACLAGRTTADYDGATLRLKGLPDYNPVAAEGLPQTANDYDGVPYGSREVGTSMGAYECETAVCTDAAGYEGVYDGLGRSITVTSLCVNVTFDWTYATSESGPYVAVNPAYTNVGTYTTWVIATAPGFRPMTNSENVIITPREVRFMFPPVIKTFDGQDAFPTNIPGGVLTTNLQKSAGHNMAGDEMFTVYGWGKFSKSDVGGGGEYLDLTNIQVVAYNGAQLSNYRLDYCVLVDGVVKSLGVLGRDKYGRATLNGKVISADSPAGSGGAITPKGENPDHDDFPPPPKEEQPDGKTPRPAPEPTSQQSIYDATNVYDGVGHTMNTNALWETVCGPNRKYIIVDEDLDKVVFDYSIDGMVWSRTPICFTNATVTSFWYRVSAPNYETNCHPVVVTILRREITVKASLQTMVCGNLASMTPGFASPAAWSDATQGVKDKGLASGQSIGFAKLWFKEENWRDAYQGGYTYDGAVVLTNWTDKTATSITLPEGDGRVIISNATEDVSRNYAITFTAGNLRVDEDIPIFTATLKWMYVSDSFVAQLTISNANKTASFRYWPGSLRFCFMDRHNTEHGDIKLWDWSTYKPVTPVETAGRAFYLADPNASAANGGWRPGLKKVYGPSGACKTVKDAFNYRTTAPFVWVQNRAAPLKSQLDDYYATLVWTTKTSDGQRGEERSIRIVATEELPRAGTTGASVKNTSSTALRLASTAAATPTAPATLTQMNAAAAYGLACDPGSESTCALTTFSVSDDAISGRIETSNNVSTGTPTGSAKVTLWGACTLDGGFSNLGTIQTQDGVFEIEKPAGYRFFKVSVGVGSEVFK